MTLRMARLIRMEDIQRLMGDCGYDGTSFLAQWPDGIDITTAPGIAAVEAMYAQGLAVEFGLAVALDQEQRTRFIGTLVAERKTMMGLTTDEEVATEVLSEDADRKQTATSIMVDIGTQGRARDLILALRATEIACLAVGDSDVQALRDRALAWFEQEALDAVAAGRVKDAV